MKASVLVITAVMLLSINITEASTSTIRVAVASNFYAPLRQLVSEFEQQNNVTVELVSASSGVLANQINLGAPFDLFFAANLEYVNRLEQRGAIDTGSTFCYARGLLVLASRSDSFSLEQSINMTSTVSLANPALAPYGAAAIQVLNQLSAEHWRIVNAHSVGQAYQHLDSNNAELAFVSRSQVSAKDVYWSVPIDWYAPITQWAGIVSTSHHKEDAQRLIDFIRHEHSQSTLAQLGYTGCDVEQ